MEIRVCFLKLLLGIRIIKVRFSSSNEPYLAAVLLKIQIRMSYLAQ